MIRGLGSKSCFALVVGALLVFAGCGGGSHTTPVRTSFVSFSPEQMQEISSSSSRPYRIQSDDILKVGFLNNQDLDQEHVLVLPDGAISLVGVDRLVVAGLTVVEADSALTAEYAKEYRDPQVSVIVRETSGLQVYVLGEVMSPGSHKIPKGGVALVGAVSMAGGFTDDAAKDGAVLVRVTESGYMVKEVDLSSFQNPGAIELATVHLMPNDIIYVPRSRIGDFGYFSKTILSGLVNMTRIATDVHILSGGTYGRY
jgi:protein involved in polysaccharide export with SLBB domain